MSDSENLIPIMCWYVYTLQSGRADRFSVGCTEDLHQRMTEHNQRVVFFDQI
jgi:predicted GIY-YIG superfamily endonuclease